MPSKKANRWNNALLGLGSNLGARRTNLTKALRELAANPKIILTKLSRFYETTPEGYLKQNKFINAAVELRTSLSPQKLLKFCQTIEKKLGRTKTLKWGPRIIDLDILTYADHLIKSKELSIPHPELTRRLFVLAPLNEIVPDQKHPVAKKSFRVLYSQLTKGRIL